MTPDDRADAARAGSQTDTTAAQSDADNEVHYRLREAPGHGDVIHDYFSFNEIFVRVLSTADHELAASNRYLFWSGLGAGGALGLTFLARVIFTHSAGESEPGLVGNLLYPIGFLIIVLGRYQLFTENTLTPVVLVLTRLASVANTLRLWIVVLIANMIGAIAVAGLLAGANVLSQEEEALAIEMARSAFQTPWYEIFSKALIAGWIVAAMVWLIHASRDTLSRLVVVFLLMYFVGAAHLYHIITSSVEVFYLAMMAPDVDLGPMLRDFVLPIFLGNTVGGVTFVAVLNYALFSEHRDAEIFTRYGSTLPFKEWMFGLRRHHEEN